MWTRITIPGFLAAAGLLVLATAVIPVPPALAKKPECISIRLVVPYAVGSATDMVVRAFSETINRTSSGGPPLRVVNVTKKSALADAIAATPDGCFLYTETQSLVADKLLDDSKRDWSEFAPVALLTRSPLVVMARGDMKDASLANVIERALEDPNAVGVGEAASALERFLLMRLEEAAGARFRIVSYPNGRESLVALLSGDLDIGFMSPTGAKRRADHKDLLALAITSEERSMLMPEVPTLKEAGVAEAFGVDRIIFAPKETPPEIVAELAKWFEKAAEDPDLVDRVGEHGTEIRYMGPEDYTRYLENLTADWKDMLKRVGTSQNRGKPG